MLESWFSSSLLPARERVFWPQAISLSTGVCLVVAVALAPLLGWALARESWILVGLLATVALIPLIIRWPVVSTFGLYAFLVPFDTVATLAEGGGATLTRLVGVLAGGVLLVAGLVERRLGRPPLAALWWVLFMVWGIVSAVWAIDPDLVFRRLPTALSLVALYFIAVSFKPTRTELYWVCLLVVAGGVAAAATGYLYGLEAAATRGTARGTLVLGGRSANPNTLAAALLLPLALVMGGFGSWRNPIHKLLALGVLGVLGIGIYMTKSRGALVMIVVAMLVFVFRTRVRWQSLVPIAMLLALVVVLPGTFFARAGMVLTGEDTTGAGRTEIWKVGLNALEHVGILGAGLENYSEVYRFSDAYSPGVWTKEAHNTFLTAWVELGVPGIVLLSAALASHLLVIRTVSRAALGGALLPALEAACFGMLAGAFFADRLWVKYFWLPWILLVWAVTNARKSRSSQEIYGS
jgi:O-antigen ligase